MALPYVFEALSKEWQRLVADNAQLEQENIALRAQLPAPGLTALETKVLRACAGHVVNDLPYGTAQQRAQRALERLGYVQPDMVDDQPTAVLTPLGREVLRELR